MARINVSIPDDIKEQMDGYSSENWSKVALEAFSNRIKILKLQEFDMDAAGLERLRVSRLSNGEREHAEGVEQGKRWALNVAEYDELERVVALAEAEWADEPWAADIATAIVGYPQDEGPQPGITEKHNEALQKAFGLSHGYDSSYIPVVSGDRIKGFITGAQDIFSRV